MIADIVLTISRLIVYHGLPVTAKILVHSCENHVQEVITLSNYTVSVDPPPEVD